MVSLLQFESDVKCDDPLGVVDIVLNLFGVPLPEEGVYFIDVIVGGQPLGNRRFRAVKTK